MIRIADDSLGRLFMDSRRGRHADRFMLWVDAVGGYWVCLGDEITLGQPDRHGTADVPILGDLSNRHACIRREGEGYLIEAVRQVSLDDRPVRDFAWLRDGSRIQLGESVQLRFRRPHAFSGTARLDFLSRHRTQPSADTVLLMSNSCVLGPKSDCHVVCRDWTRDVVLYRNEDALFCCSSASFQIDGVVCNGRGPITQSSHVQGDGFSFNLEAIER